MRRQGSTAIKAWRKNHRWTPHDLRHTAATDLRQRFGLKAASLIPGHCSPTITDATYAQRDLGVVLKAAKEAG